MAQQGFENRLVADNIGAEQILTQQKALLRERLKQNRRTMARERRVEFDQAIYIRLQAHIGQADTIFCYISAADEVNTHPIIDHLRQLGRTVVVPSIVNRDKMIAVRFTDWADLRVGQLGILTPDTDDEWQSGVDLCITPGLGFTLDGKRIGYGKGYYDKWFAAHPHSARTALCYECQIVDSIPATETDVKVEKVITERRVINCV